MSNIFIHRGCRIANSSIAAAISTGMSRCIVKSLSPDSRCVPMDDLKADLILFIPLKDLSAEQLVTCRTHRIVNKALILGYIAVACLGASVGLLGKLLLPWRCLEILLLFYEPAIQLAFQASSRRKIIVIHLR